MYGKLKTDYRKKSESINADFRNKPKSAFSFLAAKIAVCLPDCARRPYGLVGGRKSSSLRSGIFFSPSLDTITDKQAAHPTRNKNAYPCRLMSNLKSIKS